jgi:hypothetical protein
MKLPHWAIVALGLGTVVIAWVMKAQSAGDLTLPAVAVTALTMVSGVIGILSQGIGQGKS